MLDQAKRMRGMREASPRTNFPTKNKMWTRERNTTSDVPNQKDNFNLEEMVRKQVQQVLATEKEAMNAEATKDDELDNFNIEDFKEFNISDDEEESC
jgi:hypothetical protein